MITINKLIITTSNLTLNLASTFWMFTMKVSRIFVLCVFSTMITACNTSLFKSESGQANQKQSITEADYSPQKIIAMVNAKYPNDATDLIYIGAPVGFIAPREAIHQVNADVDSGKVVDIVTALTVKTSTVIITGNDDDLTEATLSKALTDGEDKIAGSKIVYVGGKQSLPNLSKLASRANVAIEFINMP